MIAEAYFIAFAVSFSYAEHCSVSNNGLRAATSYIVANAESLERTPASYELDWIRSMSRGGCAAERPNSYGDITGLIDFVVSPVELYTHEELERADRMFVEGVMPWTMLARLGRNPVNNAHAAHLNDDHFRDRALFNYWFWHRTAVGLAKEQRLGAALVINAAADHFLQDFFAPGHVMTPRRNLHDPAALAVHNSWNAKGLRMRLLNPTEQVQFARHLPETVVAAACEGSLPSCLYELSSVGFMGYGDNQLDKVPAQRLTLTLLSMRSALDILESYFNRAVVNRFDSYTWHVKEDCEGCSTAGLAALGAAEYFAPPIERTTGVTVNSYTISYQTGKGRVSGAVLQPDLVHVGGGGDYGSALGSMGFGVGPRLIVGSHGGSPGIGVRGYLPFQRLNSNAVLSAELFYVRDANGVARAVTTGLYGLEMGFGIVYLNLSVGATTPIGTTNAGELQNWFLRFGLSAYCKWLKCL